MHGLTVRWSLTGAPEGVETTTARDTFEREFKADAGGSPSSQIIGSAPTLIEPCEIIAVAEGASGFLESASFD